MDAILIDKRPFSHNLALDTSMKDTQHTTWKALRVDCKNATQIST